MLPVLVLDEDGNPLPRGVSKDEAHANKHMYCLCTNLWIYNSRGEVLLQRRADDNYLCPGCWDISAAGHVDFGEESLPSLKRELKEELGVEIADEAIEFISRFKEVSLYPPHDILHSEFADIYLLRLDVELKDLAIQEEELSEITWMPLAQFENEIQDPKLRQQYVPHGNVSDKSYYPLVISELHKRIDKA